MELWQIAVGNLKHKYTWSFQAVHPFILQRVCNTWVQQCDCLRQHLNMCTFEGKVKKYDFVTSNEQIGRMIHH